MSGGTRATVELTKRGVPFAIHEYEHDPRTTSFGLEAATALDLPVEQVFKTIVFIAETASRPEPVVAISPVAWEIDTKAVARALRAKRVLSCKPAEAERITGYVVGGISPIAQKSHLRTVIDEGALSFPKVYVSGGRRGMDISLTPADLIAVTQAEIASIAAGRA